MGARHPTLRGAVRLAIGLFAAIGLYVGAAGAAPFDPQQAYRVLSLGLETILDRYIERIPPEKLAFDALEGLAAIDDALTVAQDLDGFDLYRFDTPIARLPFPPAGRDASEDWADVIIDGVEALLPASSLLASADDERVYQALFDGALASLDRHSRYAGAANAQRQREKREGFGGIGLRFRTQDGAAVVVEVFAGGPAARAGLRAGDRIVAIDTRATWGWSRKRIAEALRGAPGTRVVLGVEHADSATRLTQTLIRRKVVPPTVSYRRDGRVAFIGVSGFNRRTGAALVATLRQAQRDFDADDFGGVVLDLRGNPGGLLDQAVAVADAFLDDGRISETDGRHPDARHVFRATAPDIIDGKPLVVLINGRTASSSELVAAALQDRGRAVLIGTTTYGKGSVQAVNDLPNRGELILTWSLIRAPSGYAFNQLGVMPTLCTAGQADVVGVLRGLDRPATSIAPLLRDWRQVAYNDVDARETLRRACPSTRQSRDIDRELAVAILNDPVLYDRLRRAAQPAVAENFPDNQAR